MSLCRNGLETFGCDNVQELLCVGLLVSQGGQECAGVVVDFSGGNKAVAFTDSSTAFQKALRLCDSLGCEDAVAKDDGVHHDDDAKEAKKDATGTRSLLRLR